MEVSNVKGLLVATIVLNSEESAEFQRLSDPEVVAKAKRAVGQVIPERLIKDILVGQENGTIQVALTI